MSIFDLTEQNNSIDNKIVAGFERLSQVLRALLWEQAKMHNLSPIQIQLLIFIRYHDAGKNNISYLAGEFNVTKPTVSDAVKVLEQKKLIRKKEDPVDSRRYSIVLTKVGERVVEETENYAAPFTGWIGRLQKDEKESLWKSLSGLIRILNQTGAITVKRTCYSCRHYIKQDGLHFCSLVNVQLLDKDIRIDCSEFELRNLVEMPNSMDL